MKCITEDEGFKLKNPQASATLATATKLLQWINDQCNKEVLEDFAKKLVECHQNCFTQLFSKSVKHDFEEVLGE